MNKLGTKRTCNLIVFLNCISLEIINIKSILNKNEMLMYCIR